jgi:hypothetical protein
LGAIPGQGGLEIPWVDRAHLGASRLVAPPADPKNARRPTVGLEAKALQKLFLDDDLVAARGQLILVARMTNGWAKVTSEVAVREVIATPLCGRYAQPSAAAGRMIGKRRTGSSTVSSRSRARPSAGSARCRAGRTSLREDTGSWWVNHLRGLSAEQLSVAWLCDDRTGAFLSGAGRLGFTGSADWLRVTGLSA